MTNNELVSLAMDAGVSQIDMYKLRWFYNEIRKRVLEENHAIKN